MMNFWKKKGFLAWVLFPFSLVFDGLTRLRYHCYRLKWCYAYRAPVPVIVVGNLSVGGTGKTPLVIALANYCLSQGLRVGIVSRGYKSLVKTYPYFLNEESTAALSGDEPLLIYRATQVPVVIDPNRARAVQTLLSRYTCDVIISDDGLQHYRLARDIEIAVLDGQRRYGNTWCLPAGPLRENLWRLNTVDFIISNGLAKTNEILMQFVSDKVYQLNNRAMQKSLSSFSGQQAYALAGIGNPERFFLAIEQAGIQLMSRKKYSDHHHFTGHEFSFSENHPIFITEKDAVKCESFQLDNVWVVPVSVKLPESFFQKFSMLLSHSLGRVINSLG